MVCRNKSIERILEDKLNKDEKFICKKDADGKIVCHTEPKNRCKTMKEIGTGIRGPILNIKRECSIEKPIDLLMKW